MRFSTWRRNLIQALGLLALGGGGWLAVYAWDSGFTKKWRRLIAKELAKHGLRAEITRLTLDPVNGLTAREVRLFDASHQDQRLATIDRVSLQIDVGSLMNGEPFLRTAQLRQANISVPVDPADESSEWLVVQGFNARLVFEDERVEIAQAEGIVSGIRVQLHGTVKKKPSAPESKAETARKKEERERRLREMRDRRGALRSVLRLVESFRIPKSEGEAPLRHKAELILEMSGDFSKPETLEVRADFTAGALENGALRLKRAEAEAELSRGQVVLKSLRLRDAHGTLHASGGWNLRNPGAGVEFSIDSGLDPRALLEATLPHPPPWLREISFDKPPRLRVRGVWLLKRDGNGGGSTPELTPIGEPPPPANPAPFSLDRPPLRAAGHVECETFRARGLEFLGLRGDFSVRDDGMFYVRNGALRHAAGEARGQLLRHAKEGARYELSSTLPPGPLLPLLPDGALKKTLERFVFSETSKVRVKCSGERGPDSPWRHAGGVEALDFQYKGVAVRGVSFSALVDGAGDPPLRFSNVRVTLPEGEAVAKALRIHPTERLLWIEDGKSGVRPAEFVAMFSTPVAAALEKYRFSLPPQLRFGGVIDLTPAMKRNDIVFRLQTPGEAELDLLKQTWTFAAVSGTVGLRGDTLELKLAGETTPGAVAGGVLRLDHACPATFEGTFSLRKDGGAPPRYRAQVRSEEPCALLALNRAFPCRGLNARLECFDNKIKVLGAGFVFNGRLGASIEFPRAGHPAHQGSIVLERASFQRLMELFDAPRDTEGLFSGTFNYGMESGGADSLRGEGDARVEDGDVFAVPLLGPLSPLVDALLPGDKLAYSVARDASGKFEVADGKVTVTNVTAVTRTFRLTAGGTVDYGQDLVALQARVNLRGAPGMILYPVSKLFEYEATGSMKSPVWKPRFLQNPFARQPTESDAPPARAPEPAPPRPATRKKRR